MRLLLCVLFVSGLGLHAFAQAAPTFAVTGVVQDQTGAVLPAATVELIDGAGSTVQTAARPKF